MAEKPEDPDLERLKLQVEIWKQAIASSVHFGEMSQKSRQIGLTIFATGRSGFGKTTAGAPASVMNSCADPDRVSVATNTAAIVIRITFGAHCRANACSKFIVGLMFISQRIADLFGD